MKAVLLIIITILTISCSSKLKNRTLSSDDCSTIENQVINLGGETSGGTIDNPYKEVQSFKADNQLFVGVQLAIGPVDSIDEETIDKIIGHSISEVRQLTCGKNIYPSSEIPSELLKKRVADATHRQVAVYRYRSKSDNKLKAFSITIFVAEKYAAFIHNKFIDIDTMIEDSTVKSGLAKELKQFGTSSVSGGLWLIH